MKSVRTWLWLCLLLVPGPAANAGQREMISGVVEPVLRQPYEYLFRPARDREPRMGLIDESVGDDFTPDTRVKLDVERTANFSGGLPVATVLRRLPDDVLWPGSFHLSPDRFAGQNTGLHPGFNEADPFAVNEPADFDSDGVSDENDSFPDDPAESDDHDTDGEGDNADPDDDNDGMPDDYETRNGLNSFGDDSLDDPDSDGVTNLEECAAGSDARDPGSFFQIETISDVRPGFVRLEWQGLPGRDYEIWHRPALTPRAELLIGPMAVAAPEMLGADIPATATNDFFFIRIVLHPPPHP